MLRRLVLDELFNINFLLCQNLNPIIFTTYTSCDVKKSVSVFGVLKLLNGHQYPELDPGFCFKKLISSLVSNFV